MSTILIGECNSQNLFQISEAGSTGETAFELIVAKAFICMYPNYLCFPFGGTFRFEGSLYRPDMALVAKDFSHWFVVEVELTSHSLEGHVIPQVRAFRYGEPQSDCVSVLAKALNKDRGQISTMLLTVPRSVVVVANKRHQEWESALKYLGVQLLAVSTFRSTRGLEAVQVDGRLIAFQEHLGFGTYSATDQAIRLPKEVVMPDGDIMLDDFYGTGSIWTVRRDNLHVWLSKKEGVPDLVHGRFVQLIKQYGGRFSIRPSPGYA